MGPFNTSRFSPRLLASIEYAIKSVKSLISKHPALQYYIIGFNQDTAYYEEIEELIQELDLRNNVHILKDADASIKESYLIKANIFILHSEEESQGIVLSEAMAVGKPVVATNVGGIPYVIQNGVNDFLSPFKEVESFAANIDKLLQNDDLRKKISEENKREALKYNWDNIVNSLLSVYTSN